MFARSNTLSQLQNGGPKCTSGVRKVKDSFNKPKDKEHKGYELKNTVEKGQN